MTDILYIYFDSKGAPVSVTNSEDSVTVNGEKTNKVLCPFSLTEATEIVKKKNYFFDGNLIQPITLRPNRFYSFDWSNKEWTADVDDAKAHRWDEIKADRLATLYGGFTHNGMTFDSDPTSQQLIQGAVLSAQIAASEGRTFSKTWTLENNTETVIDGPAMIEIGKAMDTHIEKCYIAGQLARKQINTATTVDEVLAVDYDSILASL